MKNLVMIVVLAMGSCVHVTVAQAQDENTTETLKMQVVAETFAVRPGSFQGALGMVLQEAVDSGAVTNAQRMSFLRGYERKIDTLTEAGIVNCVAQMSAVYDSANTIERTVLRAATKRLLNQHKAAMLRNYQAEAAEVDRRIELLNWQPAE